MTSTVFELKKSEEIAAKEKALELLMIKVATMTTSLERIELRITAMRNTATQFRKHVDKMQGEIRSFENTARNTENLLNDNKARLKQMSKSILILQTPPEDKTS